eukprot:CAMPEP_0113300354 /NCGR_PEP_ID=MMETSP0010_2-20120614/2021_1 /TAXON_ID=216773 ORGANISM="Corethron hystrix, Strain 308" /NCGR_SAMPLE_ID=MMETSP0010_2 /ASSEMBLY_ACC=CAM_ASM_000155 /LENGTH=72 /DNA_ID=CAMNT_0000153769 /DNA_START=448 /DNA_END=666 /DNA_ORIENTATION=- /assembly_acc=CAM_ASM_000155
MSCVIAVNSIEKSVSFGLIVGLTYASNTATHIASLLVLLHEYFKSEDILSSVQATQLAGTSLSNSFINTEGN